MISLLGGVFLGWSLGANDASNIIVAALAVEKYATSLEIVYDKLTQGPCFPNEERS
ncbi:MAG: hypothetical protein R6X22_03285 [Gemmatimonadota bacterium]